MDLGSPAGRQLVQFVAEDHLGCAGAAVHDGDVAGRAGHVLEQRPDRRDADAAGYTIGDRIGLPAEIGRLLTGYPGVITAVAALAILVAVTATSARRLRRRLRYETWHFTHLYVYFDLATEQAESQQLEELARDAQLEDLPKHGDTATTVVARLDAASKAAAGGEVDLVLESEEIKLFDPKDGNSLTH